MSKIIKPSRECYGTGIVVTPLIEEEPYHFQPRKIKVYDITREGDKLDWEKQFKIEGHLIHFMQHRYKRIVSPGNMGLGFLINNLAIEPVEISLNGWNFNKKKGIHLSREVFVYKQQLREIKTNEVGEYEVPIIEHETIAMEKYIQGESFEFETWLNSMYSGIISFGHFARR